MVNFTSRSLYPRVSTENDAGWAPERVWTFWKREKSVAPKGNGTPDRSANSLVTMLACRQFNFNIGFFYVPQNGDLLAIYLEDAGNSGTSSFY
jgi:hypothetical protein